MNVETVILSTKKNRDITMMSALAVKTARLPSQQTRSWLVAMLSVPVDMDLAKKAVYHNQGHIILDHLIWWFG